MAASVLTHAATPAAKTTSPPSRSEARTPEISASAPGHNIIHALYSAPASIPVYPPAEPPRRSGNFQRGETLPLQRKLIIGSTTDPLESEADAMADNVLRRQSISAIHSGASSLLRKCACERTGNPCDSCKAEKNQLHLHPAGPITPVEAPRIVHDVIQSPGRPLDAGTREEMEAGFGHDLSHVRIHTDAKAAESARSVRALAYTVGHNVVFGAGQFDTHSMDKRRLLAHELAHTLQQSSGTAGGEPAGAEGGAMNVSLSNGLRVARQAASNPEPHNLTEDDAKTCSPHYLQKLCVFIKGGFNGDRSGVETKEEIEGHNQHCRAESGYQGKDVELSDEDRAALRSPKCSRGDPESARKRAHAERLSAIIDRSFKYMPAGRSEQLEAMIHDPIFLGSLAVAVTLYAALWLFPEPVFTKIAAAATTIAILATGVFSISTIVNLAGAWMDLHQDAGTAQTDEQMEAAAQRFGKRIGAVEADLLVFLGSLLVGGKLPVPKGLPGAGVALADAERAVSSASEGGVVIKGPWGDARAVRPSGGAAPSGAAPEGAMRGNLALKIEPTPAQVPDPGRVAEVVPLRPPKPVPAPVNATAPAAGPGQAPVVVPPVAPGVGTKPAPEDEKKKPPFVLRLPQQKAPHLERYRSWLGVLQSDPNFLRGNPAQREFWHQALRIGGSNPIPAEVYERGHRLGFTGETGERRIRIPDWSQVAQASVAMEVDHIIELQLTPAGMREEFNSISNMELLDASSNHESGNELQKSIALERNKQAAFDPSSRSRVLQFDQVVMGSGSNGQRWEVDELQAGKQLDRFEEVNPT